MISLEILLLGLALAIDAGIVSFALGVTTADEGTKRRLSLGFLTALTFGFFQFFMLWLGSYGGYVLTFSSFGHLTQIIVCGVFLLIGLKLFQDSFKDAAQELHWGIFPILMLAVATSIDALAAGISLGALPDARESAIKIGMITFFVCAALFLCSFLLKSIPHKWLMRVGGVIFAGLGIRIIYFYLSTGAL